MPQLGASLTSNSRGIIYKRNLFIKQILHQSEQYLYVIHKEKKSYSTEASQNKEES
jgi:hypothetical protein